MACVRAIFSSMCFGCFAPSLASPRYSQSPTSIDTTETGDISAPDPQRSFLPTTTRYGRIEGQYVSIPCSISSMLASQRETFRPSRQKSAACIGDDLKCFETLGLRCTINAGASKPTQVIREDLYHARDVKFSLYGCGACQEHLHLQSVQKSPRNICEITTKILEISLLIVERDHWLGI